MLYLPTNTTTKYAGLFVYRMHKPRPFWTALQHRAEHVTAMQIANGCETLSKYGLPGFVVEQRTGIKVHGLRSYLHIYWVEGVIELSQFIRVPLARRFGLRGFFWVIEKVHGLLWDALNSETKTVRHHLIEALLALDEEIHPEAKAARERREVEVEAKRDAEYEAWLKEPSEFSPSALAACQLWIDFGAHEKRATTPSLDVLMWKVWSSVLESERLSLFASMLDDAFFYLPEDRHEEFDCFGPISHHIMGQIDSVEYTLFDLWPDEQKGVDIARDNIARWRANGAGWLADIYEPRVNERAEQVASGNNLTKAA